MPKYNVTRFAEPLTVSELEEIKQLLIPIKQQEERNKLAQDLKSGILYSLKSFIENQEFGHETQLSESSFIYLNNEIKRVVDNWYETKSHIFGSDVKGEDVWVKISEDGLYVFEYSDFVKEVLTNPNFKTETIQVTLPPYSDQLVSEINKHLEQEAQKE